MQKANFILSDLYDLAYRAHTGTSFSPEKRAEMYIKDYSQELENDLANMPEDQKERYTANYRKYFTDWMHSKSRIVSTMIAGASNFPVARMEKYNRWEHNKSEAFRNWRKKALNAIARKIQDAKSPEQKINEEWEIVKKGLISSLGTIAAIDEGTERGYNRALFVSSIALRLKTYVKNGQTEIVNRYLDLIEESNRGRKKPLISSRHKIWNYREKAEAKREEIVDNSNRESIENEINGCKVLRNFQADRVQIFFPEKPNETIRTLLRKSAWKWSPSNGCWQRKLTMNAMYSARDILNQMETVTT